MFNPRTLSMKEQAKNVNNFFRKQQAIKEIDNDKIKLRPPDYINLFKYSVSGKPILPKKESVCLNCGQKVENYRLYEISFKTIIEGHDNRKRDKKYYSIFNKINMTSSGIEVMPVNSKKYGEKNEIVDKLKANKINNFIIPKIIQELYPKLKFQDYFNLKYDTFFRNKTTCVCDDCYLEITKYCSMAGSNNENLIKTFKKDVINPIFDMFKSMRPKSVANKVKGTYLTELGKNINRKNSIRLFKNKKDSLVINEENPNQINPIIYKPQKRQTMSNLYNNYHLPNQNLTNNNINNQISENIKNKRIINKNLPLLNLESITEINLSQNKGRRNKRNKTTLVLNTNLKNITNTQEKEKKLKGNENEKMINNTTSIFNKAKSLSKKKSPQNFFSKTDFKYFV